MDLDLTEWKDRFPIYKKIEDFKNNFLIDYYRIFGKEHKITLGVFLFNCFERVADFQSKIEEGPNTKHNLQSDDFLDILKEIHIEILRYSAYQHEHLSNLDDINSKLEAIKMPKAKVKTEFNQPEKIGILLELGIMNELQNIPIKEDRYRVMHAIIGGDYDNLKKYVINGISNDNERTAKEFINSKRI